MKYVESTPDSTETEYYTDTVDAIMTQANGSTSAIAPETGNSGTGSTPLNFQNNEL